MWVLQGANWVLMSSHLKKWSFHGSSQGRRSLRVAYSRKQDGCPGVPRLCKLLLKVHLRLLCHSLILLWPNTLWTSLDMEWKRADGLRGPQNSGDHHFGVNIPSGLGALPDQSRQLRLCHRSIFVSVVDNRQKMASHGVLQQVLILCGTKLQNPWQGNTSHYLHVRKVEVLPRRNNSSGRDLDWPQEPRVFHNGQET